MAHGIRVGIPVRAAPSGLLTPDETMENASFCRSCTAVPYWTKVLRATTALMCTHLRRGSTKPQINGIMKRNLFLQCTAMLCAVLVAVAVLGVI